MALQAWRERGECVTNMKAFGQKIVKRS